jgi:HD-GYP domain-containing protein (c-di-GMP phosphodiesterase class II)
MRQTTPLEAEVQSPAIPILQALLAAWQAAALYEENNDAYRSRRDKLLSAIGAVSKTGQDCRLDYQGGYFFFNEERLNYDQEFYFGRALAFRFSTLELGQILIRASVSPTSIDQALFALAHADSRHGDPFEALSETWATLGIGGITIERATQSQPGPWDIEGQDQDSEAARRQRAHAMFIRAESIVQEMWERVRDRNSLDSSSTQRVVHLLIDEIAHDEEILLEFVALKDFDEYTYYHSVNVAIYSIAVGMRVGLDRRQLTQLGMAALFHDIGKVKLPHDLITKPDEFNEDEWEQIKLHPVLGALTIASLRPIDADTGLAMVGAFEHHLRMDGSGYPKLSEPRKPNLVSRIIAVCDVYDAMTAGRVYQKKPITPDDAIRRLMYKGREWYDPLILKALIHVLGIFPVGTLMRLSDGCLGIVVRNRPEDVYAPEILVIRDAKGSPTRRLAVLPGRGEHETEDALYVEEILDPSAEGIRIADYIAVGYCLTEDLE